ncbi:glycosyltransferase [Saccharolobus solfataricus]|nr:glycosyltransferase [Saccharolobus solfataricus]
MPFVSVIVTAYQYRPYIVEALESIAHQDLDDNKYEVIIVANYDKGQVSRYLCNGWKFIYHRTQEVR